MFGLEGKNFHLGTQSMGALVGSENTAVSLFLHYSGVQYGVCAAVLLLLLEETNP